MTQEKFNEAKALDAQIAEAHYWLHQANLLKNWDGPVKIVADGCASNLAIIEPKDGFRETIAEVLITKYKNEIETLKIKFNNL